MITQKILPTSFRDFSCSDDHLPIGYSLPDFQPNWDNFFAARSEGRRQEFFSTSNRSKPIRVLTRTDISCSDDHLPIGYLLRDFQPNWSNFFLPTAAAAAALTRYEGGRHLGGASAPPNPPREIAPIIPCIILLKLRQIWDWISRISVISIISRKSRKKLEICQLQIALKT